MKFLVERKSKCTDRSTGNKDKKKKKIMLDNLNDNGKEYLRQGDNRGKKEKGTKLDSDEKEQL